MKIKKFQEGGMAPEMAPQDPAMAGAPAGAEAAPAEAGAEQDPLMQLGQVAAQALQAQDCEAAMAVCEGLMQLLEQAMGGAPAEEAPMGEPVFKCGGKLKGRKVKKACGGMKAANGIKIESKKGDIHKDKNRHDNRF